MAETLPALPVDLSDLAARAAEFARSSRSAATERAYRSDWADFWNWCGRAGLSPLPASPATVGAYLSARATELKVATLNRRIAAITVAHRTAGLGLDGDHPAIARVLAGIRRAYGTLKKPEIRTGGGAWRVRRARGSRPVAFIMSANLARRHMTTKSP